MRFATQAPARTRYEPPEELLARPVPREPVASTLSAVRDKHGRLRRTLPEDWVTFGTWCKGHGLYGPKVLDQIAAGALPLYYESPADEAWHVARKPPGKPIRYAWSPARHAEACRIARELWPDEYTTPCGLRCPDQEATTPGAAGSSVGDEAATTSEAGAVSSATSANTARNWSGELRIERLVNEDRLHSNDKRTALPA